MDFTGVRQEADGNFSYRIKKTLKNGQKIDTKIRGFATKREAKRARDERVAELYSAPQVARARRIRYDGLFAEFLRCSAIGNRKYATIIRYESLHKNYLHQAFGQHFAASITPAAITAFLQKLAREGKSLGYIDSFHKQIHTVLQYGVKCEYLDSNAADLAQMPARDIADAHARDIAPKIILPDEIAALANSMRGKLCETPFMLGLYMGLRVSEAFAVRWCDIDFETQTMRIDKQLQYQRYAWHLVPPKTYSGYRSLAMPDCLCAYLKQLFKDQQARRRKYGASYKTSVVHVKLTSADSKICEIDDFICAKKNGEMLTPSAARYITDAAKKLNIAGFHFHLLRHTHASILANSNVSAILMKERLGHEKVETTWKFYSHVTPDARAKFGAALNEVYSAQWEQACDLGANHRDL